MAGGVLGQRVDHVVGAVIERAQADRGRAGGVDGELRAGGVGHLGDRQVTVQKLEVVRVDPERQLMLVRGAVPGARNGLLLIRKAQ